MKTIIFVMLALSVTKSYSQSGVPKSIEALGEVYVAEYKTFKNDLALIKNSFADTKNSINTTKGLYENANVFWDTRKDANSINYNDAMVSNLESMITSGNFSSSNIKVNNLEFPVFSFLSDIQDGIINIDEKTGIDNYLLGFSNRLVKLRLTAESKRIIAYYIMTLNAVNSFVTSEAYVNSGASSRWSLWGAIKCAAGTVGGAVLGGLAGAGAGTVTLPVIGTVAGTAVGFWGGALAGVAAAC